MLAGILLPPLVAAGVTHTVWFASDGERRCFESLDLETPGLVCAPSLTFVFLLAICLTLQLLIWLPVALAIRHTGLNSSSLATQRRIVWSATFASAISLFVGVGLGWSGSSHSFYDTLVSVVLPLSIGCFLALAPPWFRAA